MDSRGKKSLTEKRKLSTKPSNEQAPKKQKIMELALMDPQVFDNRMDEFLKKAVEIYHGIPGHVSNDKDQIAYLSILKKVCITSNWENQRIISSKNQIMCFTEKDSLTQSDMKKFQIYLSNWIKHRISAFRCKSKNLQCIATSDAYKQKISSYGVTLDDVDVKISQRRGSVKEIEEISYNLNETTESNKIEACRLCGSSNSQLISNLYDLSGGDDIVKNLIQHYCRVDLDDNPRLSTNICVECKNSLDSFLSFREKIESYQQTLKPQISLIPYPIKEEVIEHITPPSPPLSSSTEKESPKRSPILLIDTIQGFNCAQEPYVPIDDNVFYDDFDSINELIVLSDHMYSRGSTPMSNLSETQVPVAREDINTLKATIKECKVSLYQLPIIFMPSDTESDSEDEDYDEDIPLQEIINKKSRPIIFMPSDTESEDEDYDEDIPLQEIINKKRRPQNTEKDGDESQKERKKLEE